MENDKTQNVVNNDTNTTNNAVNNAKGKLGGKSPVVIVVAAVIGLVVLVALFALIFGGGAKGAVKGYCNGYRKMNAEKVVKYLYFEDEDDRDDEVDVYEDLFEKFEDEDQKIKSFKIVDSYKFNKDELDEFAENMEKYQDIDEKDIKAAHTFYLRVTADDDGDRSINYMELIAYKVKNKWYVKQ